MHMGVPVQERALRQSQPQLLQGKDPAKWGEREEGDLGKRNQERKL